MHAGCAGNLLELASLPLHCFNLSPLCKAFKSIHLDFHNNIPKALLIGKDRFLTCNFLRNW